MVAQLKQYNGRRKLKIAEKKIDLCDLCYKLFPGSIVLTSTPTDAAVCSCP